MLAEQSGGCNGESVWSQKITGGGGRGVAGRTMSHSPCSILDVSEPSRHAYRTLVPHMTTTRCSPVCLCHVSPAAHPPGAPLTREPSDFFAASGSPAPGRFSSAGSGTHLHATQQQQQQAAAGAAGPSSSVPLSRAVSCNSPGGFVVGTPPRGTLRFPSGGVRSAMSSPAPGAAAAAGAATAGCGAVASGAAAHNGSCMGGVGAHALGVAAFFSPTELMQASIRQQQDTVAARLSSTSGRLDSVSSLGDLPENRVFQGQLAPVVPRQRRSSVDGPCRAAAAAAGQPQASPPPPPTEAAAAGLAAEHHVAAGPAGAAGGGGDAGSWLSGCPQGGGYTADGASTSSSRCASLEPSSMWGSIAAASRRESMIEPAAGGLGAARSISCAAAAVLEGGGCVAGDAVSPAALPTGSPGQGVQQDAAGPTQVGNGAPAGSVLPATSSCYGGGGVILGMCGEPAVRGVHSCSSGSSYRGSCFPGGSSYSSTPATTASNSCTPFSPQHPSALVTSSSDAGVFCQSDQTQAGVQQSYLAIQAGVWGHLPPPARELESPGSSLSSDESPGKRRCGRALAAAAGAGVGGVVGGGCGGGVSGGNHLSRLSQNSMPAAGFLTSRTSSSCTGVDAVLALPELPEVDFIERIGKGCFGEVYKGGAGRGGERRGWGAEGKERDGVGGREGRTGQEREEMGGECRGEMECGEGKQGEGQGQGQGRAGAGAWVGQSDGWAPLSQAMICACTCLDGAIVGRITLGAGTVICWGLLGEMGVSRVCL